ncbi:(2R)-3-sulfolactate dehydrogenase (NADP(+))-like [Diadema antillarum]|uniref:(2R)-3-sulfolactate dehydrogenase (NADP(+))-like n=1 Tax=Diadema antillarum TaxID=105358 RepID=UPI003A89CA62
MEQSARLEDGYPNSKGTKEEREKALVLVREENVCEFVAACMEAAGLKDSHALVQSEVLLDADRRGKTSHGLQLLDVILANVQAGTVVNGEPEIMEETSSSAWVNGRGAPGAVVGMFCMDVAMKKAATNGIGWVSAKGSHHLGALGWYTMRACNNGMIGVCMSNTWLATVAPLSKQRALGTNPISFAAPALDGDYILFDSSLTVSAMGKIREAVRSGSKHVQAGLGVDQFGVPTQDAETILFHGGVVPLGGSSTSTGGHKGFGLLLLVEILTSVLAGSAFCTDIAKKSAETGAFVGEDFGQTFIAIDPAHFGSGFVERMQRLLDYCRQLDRVDESQPVRIPGDQGREHIRRTKQDGGLWYQRGLIQRLNAKLESLGGSVELREVRVQSKQGDVTSGTANMKESSP